MAKYREYTVYDYGEMKVYREKDGQGYIQSVVFDTDYPKSNDLNITESKLFLIVFFVIVCINVYFLSKYLWTK